MLQNRYRILITIRNVLVVFVFIFIIHLYRVKSSGREEVFKYIASTDMEHLFRTSNVTTRKINKSEIESFIEANNRKETILNYEMYGPIKKNTVVLVVFVRETSLALRFMLLSLSQVKGIQDVLLIFSHLYYDDQANALIKTIDFCRVLQIYYPYSLQLHPDSFPGFTSGDCPYYVNLKLAEFMNCTGVQSYDIHGRYRNPHLSEKKHYWWWTANQVFENLTCTDGHDGTFIFIDDYYFLIEDLIYMTVFMKNLSAKITRCDFLSLASTHLVTRDKHDAVEVTTWDPVKHSGVLAFDLSVWNNIVSHYNHFCSIDDNSWAQSLSYVSMNRREGGMYRVMSTVFPRAIKLASCVSFDKLMDCTNDNLLSVDQILKLQNQIRTALFPPNLEISIEIELADEYMSFDYVESNGGWNDPRDHDLCKNITVNKIKKEIMDMDYQFEMFSSSVEK